MSHKRRRNPNQFTADEIATAVLAYTEGGPICKKSRGYLYPQLQIGMCVKEGLEPASRAFQRKIMPSKRKVRVCEPEDFPPDGKGSWHFTLHRAEVLRLAPLIPKRFLEKWDRYWEEKGCLRPIRPWRRRRRSP